MTKFIKKEQLSPSWYEIDATNAVVGRLATVISKIIRGKNKATYTPHMNSGDFVVVKNIEQIKFTGKKFQNKKYYKHTGHPGGIKETTPEKLKEKKPGEILKLAVKRMLPNGVLGREQLSKLKIYTGDTSNTNVGAEMIPSWDDGNSVASVFDCHHGCFTPDPSEVSS